MILTSIEKLANSIGFNIGNSNNVVQSDLLNGLAQGLGSGIDNQKLELQYSYIENGLTEEAKNIIKELSEFIKLSDDRA